MDPVAKEKNAMEERGDAKNRCSFESGNYLFSEETMERLGADDIIVGKRPRGYPADELHDFAEVSPSHVCVHRDAFRRGQLVGDCAPHGRD